MFEGKAVDFICAIWIKQCLLLYMIVFKVALCPTKDKWFMNS